MTALDTPHCITQCGALACRRDGAYRLCLPSRDSGSQGKHRPRLTYNNGSTTLAGDPDSAKCIFFGQHEAYPVEILGKTTQYYLTSLPRPPGPEGSRLCLIDQLLLL